MKKKFLVIVSLLCLAIMLFTLVACNETPQTVVSVTISSTSEEIEIGETVRINARSSDGASIVWTSDNTDVATVSSAGTVTGVAEGETIIKATSGSDETAYKICKITVLVPPTRIRLSDTTKEMDVAETYKIVATVNDGTAVGWSSGDESVASVSADGTITANAAGAAVITATAGDASETCTVIVFEEQAVDYKEIKFGEDETAKLNPGVFYFWNDQLWLGATVTMSRNEYNNGKYIFGYYGNDHAFNGMQIYCENSALVTGEEYKLTVKINSSAAGKATLNGNVIELAVGDNDIEVVYTENTAPSFTLQMGERTDGSKIESAVIRISDISYAPTATEFLTAPTAININADGVVTVTDANEIVKDEEDNDIAKTYKLYFYDSTNELKYTEMVHNGETLNRLKYADDVYTVKAQVAVYGGKGSSVVSEVSATLAIANGSGAKINNSNNDAMIKDNINGVFCYYNESWNKVEVVVAQYINGKAHIEFTGNDDYLNAWAMQILYNDASLTIGTTYTVKFTLNTNVGGPVQINGVNFDLEVGNNDIECTFTADGTNVSLKIIFGPNDDATRINAATIEIGAVTYTPMA